MEAFTEPFRYLTCTLGDRLKFRRSLGCLWLQSTCIWQQISPLFSQVLLLASLLMTKVPADFLTKLVCSQHCFLKPVVLCMLRACFMCLVHNSLLVCTCWGSRVSRAYSQQVVPRECLGKQMLEGAGVNRCCSDLSACPVSQVSGGYSVTENDWLKQEEKRECGPERALFLIECL